MDSPLEILDEYPADLLEIAKRCLSFLESIDWRWDLKTVLDQPAELMSAIMALKSIGEEIRRQDEEKKKAPD